MHLTELSCLDGVVSVKGVRNPIVVVVVSTTLDLCLVPNGLTLLLAAPGARATCTGGG
jgi:hypothetical protein